MQILKTIEKYINPPIRACPNMRDYTVRKTVIINITTNVIARTEVRTHFFLLDKSVKPENSESALESARLPERPISQECIILRSFRYKIRICALILINNIEHVIQLYAYTALVVDRLQRENMTKLNVK